MSEAEIYPQEIKLHQQSRTLELLFNDGKKFNLPYTYLRVFSPASEVNVLDNHGRVLTGKENVAIEQVTPVGNYALQIHFSDGHDAGVYSWKTLYELGEKQDEYWALYQKQLSEHQSGDGSKVNVLYFVTLVEKLGKKEEKVQLPASVKDVAGLIKMLGFRGEHWKEILNPDDLTITVNKEFAGTHTAIFDGDEIAFVPKNPVI